MGYKENLEPEDESIAPDILNDDELSFEDEDSEDSEFSDKEVDPAVLEANSEDGNKKSKTQTFSLQARRAIEDHLEQRRLRKELDYLYDDEFAQSEETKK